jgi:delta 1-pyrroline-5-carboxylate dehydrogenase
MGEVLPRGRRGVALAARSEFGRAAGQIEGSTAISKHAIEDLAMFIDGEWHHGSGARLDVVNPATAEVLTTIPDGVEADLDRAVASARQGLAVWRNTHPRVRTQVLFRIAETIKSRAEEFAHLDGLNLGE